MQITITSNGQQIGTISTDEFRKTAGVPKLMFLPEAIATWNRHKTKLGEPERAELQITTGYPVAPASDRQHGETK